MPVHQIVSSSLSGPVAFSDDEWARIEAAGKRPIDAELRKQVQGACLTYLLLYQAEDNRISDAAIRKDIDAILAHSKALQSLLLPQKNNEPRNVALKLIGAHLRPPHSSLAQVFPAWVRFGISPVLQIEP